MTLRASITDVPTVEIRTGVYVPAGDDRWAWRPATPVIPDAREYVYSSEELNRVMVVYGCVVAASLRRSTRVERFRLVAHEARRDRRVIGVYEWHRSTETGRFLPAEEPLIHWRNPPRKLARA